jgi:hypothetical protein
MSSREWIVTVLLFPGMLAGQTSTAPVLSMNPQSYQRPEACLPCHQRQFDELRSAVKAGYRNVSPLMNGLEIASNFLNGGLLRPVYADSSKMADDGTPLKSNLASTRAFTNVNQAQAGFCLSCHNPHIEVMGEDPTKREVPELPGTLSEFRPDLIRPLRDYHLVDNSGRQVLPSEIGGPAPTGAQPSLGAAGISCDLCHNVTGAGLNRSLQQDGFANMSLEFFPSIDKVGLSFFPSPRRTGSMWPATIRIVWRSCAAPPCAMDAMMCAFQAPAR